MTRPLNRRSKDYQVIVAKRRLDVLNRLLKREAPNDIAEALNVSIDVVRQDKYRVLEDLKRDIFRATDDLVAQERLLLDDDERKLRKRWDAEEDTELWLKIWDRILKAMDRRAKMMGLDAQEDTKLDRIQVQQIVALLARAAIDVITDVAQRQLVVVKFDEVLTQMGAGVCLSPPESTESER